MKVQILGININTERKAEILEQLETRVKAGRKVFLVTPYSEFFYRSFFDYDFKDVLNKADFALPDGVAVQWLSYYLDIPFRLKSFYGKVIEATWQALYSLLQIVFNRKKVSRVIPEKISGSDFFWDLIELAVKNNLRIYLLGGYGRTADKVKAKVLQKYPKAIFAGQSSQNPSATGIVENINSVGADLLIVAYGPVKQEKWIWKHLPELNVKIAIGLGGTFDYVAGNVARPPRWVRLSGFEWLFRLITQPHRFQRIWSGTFRLIRGAIRQKVFMSMPFRPNVVGVIINDENKIFVAKRIMKHSSDNPLAEEHWQFPQGGVDPGEDYDLAVLREIREEVGTDALQILGKSEKQNTYLWNHALRNLLFNRLKFRGQEQSIYYLRYTGDQSDIKLDQTELIAWRWIDIDQLESVVHKFRKDLVNIVKEEIQKYVS